MPVKNEPIQLTDAQRKEIDNLLRRPTTPQCLSQRLHFILALAAGESAYSIAKRTDTDAHTVGKWRKRFQKDGIDGLRDDPRSGRPRNITPEKVTQILHMTMHCIPEEATHWSLSLMAKYAKVSIRQVQNVWGAAGLKPHLTATFNYSKDPDFAQKVIDVIGLYMNELNNAVVLSLDEKTQIQALDHTQPMLQLRPGQVQRHTHDYERHGTTSLYAAFDISSGKIIGRTNQRHRAKEFISFLNLVDRRMKARKGYDETTFHIILDNVSTHKTKEVKKWLANHPNYTFHFTPTSSSWLNAVEGVFSKIERYGLRGKAFKSVKELREHLRQFIVTYNKRLSKPFIWTKPAGEVIAKAQRGKEAALSQEKPKVIVRDFR